MFQTFKYFIKIIIPTIIPIISKVFFIFSFVPKTIGNGPIIINPAELVFELLNAEKIRNIAKNNSIIPIIIWNSFIFNNHFVYYN